MAGPSILVPVSELVFLKGERRRDEADAIHRSEAYGVSSLASSGVIRRTTNALAPALVPAYSLQSDNIVPALCQRCASVRLARCLIHPCPVASGIQT